MMIASMIVEIEAEAEHQVLPELARMAGVSTYGIKDRQIVTVVEADTMTAVNGIVQEISRLDRIIGVYPVFAGEHG
jgi:nitrate reductase NapAB chaperone NapD